MGTDNYKTGLMLSQRCVGLEDKAAVVTGGRSRLNCSGDCSGKRTQWHNTYVSKSEIR